MIDVIIRRDGTCGRITLNRPRALHALTLQMCRDIIDALLHWETDTGIQAVMIDHSEGRGFCAGGDLRLLYESLRRGDGEALAFFHTEYRMNHLLFTYSKPTVCFMDGIVMGGGAGIAMPCRYRIVTEQTKFAMPETGIGLIPDVGGGWFLSRLEGRVGQWLVLTGARLDGGDCLALRLATHYLPREKLGTVKADFETLHKLAIAPPKNFEHRGVIDRLFAQNQVEDVIAALRVEGSHWAAIQVTEIEKKSPRSCKVALRQLAKGRRFTEFSDNMRMEYRIVSRLLAKPDFMEGVRAFIIDKDDGPCWTPPRLQDVDETEIEAIFAPLPGDQEWTPLRSEKHG